MIRAAGSSYVRRLVIFPFSLVLGCCGPQASNDPRAEVAASPPTPALASAPREHPGQPGELRITHIGPVAPDTIAITLRAGTIVHGDYVPYHEQAGDRLDRNSRHRAVYRNGDYLGTLVGRNEDQLRTPDRFVGAILPEDVDSPELYTVTSSDDPAFADGLSPSEVGRKTKPLDIAFDPQRGWWSATETVVYLILPHELREGSRYRIGFDLPGLDDAELTYADQAPSDAVHVSQLGFRPDDPVKVAFLSTWMGTAGPLDYPSGLAFSIVDASTGEVAFEGTTELAKAHGQAEDASGRNFNGTDVHLMTFDDLTKEGEYVVQVAGIGRSHPFPIDAGVWKQAFYGAARGFYHQRSGIALGPPFTDFERPRPFHPDDGIEVLQSTCPLMESGNGLSYGGRSKDNFACLVDGKTDEIVPAAWGGYMDAGDWDRRIQHLQASRYLLELTEMYPALFEDLTLDIPESGGPLPDTISEALFNLDFFRRLQTADGGIRGGIESADHPRRGEASWQESLDVLAYAPGIWSSHWYAGAAARAAFVLRRYDQDLAGQYQQSAVAAMTYAEDDWAELGQPEVRAGGVVDMRNLAAVELFRLTGEQRWHDIFLETTVFQTADARLSHWPDYSQDDAAWVYVQTEQPGVDARVQETCRSAILGEADQRVDQALETGFRWTKNPWAAAAWGTFAVPDGISMARAHKLTGDEKYLRGVILASQHGAGANPLNMSYTTGVGHNTPEHPLHIDARMSGQTPPPGLTIFGPLGFKEAQGQWGQSLADPFLVPAFQDWPTLEAYWDIYVYGAMNEFTINSMAKNTYVWGYLAAAPR